MTKAQCDSPEGLRLLNLIVDICHDGEVSNDELMELHAFLTSVKKPFAAITYLRAITREVLQDEAIDPAELYRLKLAFMRIVPKDIRGVVATHLENIGAPSPEWERDDAPWRNKRPTEAQLGYIASLGGDPDACSTRGAASDTIEHLLHHRPPTPRQMMLLRFFDRTDLADRSKEEILTWIDSLFWQDTEYELAWQRFKNHPPAGFDDFDPETVPLGSWKNYTRR